MAFIKNWRHDTIYRKRVRYLLILAVLAMPASARASSVTPAMDRLLVEGVDAIYRMDFDAADDAARRAIALQPDYPHAYLGAAATDFIRYMYGSEQSDPSLLPSFERKAQKSIDVSEAWLRTHPNDADVLLVLGSGYGISARLALDRHQWLRGWRDGSRAMKSVRAALAADPQLYDADLGLGMFDYYVDTIPRFMGWLAKIMLGGSRARGLAELKLAAEKGRYARTAAQMILVEIYTQDRLGARNPPEAVRLMKEIRAKYPDSSMIHSAYVVSLYEDRRYDEAVREAREYLARVRSGKHPAYPALDLSGAHALLGTVLWGSGKIEEALAEYREGADHSPARTRWTVWCRVREGQALDALGRRDEALAAYRAAYAEPDLWDYRALIKPCLAAPCVGAQYPGHVAAY
jgi:tetratricopeptide (TPR) repeat protein